jgi:hypothetical protein
LRLKFPSEYQRKPENQMRKQVEWHLNKIYQEINVRRENDKRIIVHKHSEKVL